MEEETRASVERAPLHISIIAQTNEISSEERKARGGFSLAAPVYTPIPGQSPAVSDADSSASGSNHSSREGSATSATFQSTFKTLVHPSSVSDNVFDELETRRPTSWQFELHQRKCRVCPLYEPMLVLTPVPSPCTSPKHEQETARREGLLDCDAAEAHKCRLLGHVQVSQFRQGSPHFIRGRLDGLLECQPDLPELRTD